MREIGISAHKLKTYVGLGLSSRQISEKFDCSLSTVLKHMRRSGIGYNNTTSRIDIDRDRFTEMWKSGGSISSMQTEFGCSYKTIVNRSKVWNLSHARPNRALETEYHRQEPNHAQKFARFGSGIPPHPMWDPQLDFDLFCTGGNWRKMSEFCSTTGKTAAQATLRYHVIISCSKNHAITRGAVGRRGGQVVTLKEIAKIRIKRKIFRGEVLFCAIIRRAFCHEEMLTKWQGRMDVISYIDRLKEDATPPKLRPCMCCAEEFLSTGIGNRLCMDCRRKSLTIFDR